MTGPQAKTDRGAPAPGTEQMLAYRLARMAGGRTRAVLAALADRRALAMADIEALYRHHGWALTPGSLLGVITEVKNRLRGSGWHCDYDAGTGARLLEGENPRARASTGIRTPRPPALSRVPETPRAPPPVSERIIAGRRELSIPAPPHGACAYYVVREGKAAPCGAPAKGTYCAAHKAKSAGHEGLGGWP